MPENRHLSLVALEADKVENEGVDDLVRQGVLLVEEDADEETVRAWSSHALSVTDRRRDGVLSRAAHQCIPSRPA